MAKLFTAPFAGSGDKTVVPDTVQGDGSISIPAGWGTNYEKASGDPNYMPVGRRHMNQLFNWITEALVELQTYSSVVWQTRTGGWPINSIVIYNGVLYKSTANGNTATPPAAPWALLLDYSALVPLDGSRAMTSTLTLGAAGSAAMHAVTKSQLDSAISGGVFAGCVVGAAFNPGTSPTGWLKANGAAVSRTTYAALFAAISTTYGAGDGSATFNLPDFRGLFLRGLDDGRGIDSGRALGSFQDSQNLWHNHAGATGENNFGHTHSGNTAWAGDHNHGVWGGLFGSRTSVQADAPVGGNNTTLYTSTNGNHYHPFTTDGVSNNHQHGISGDGGSETRVKNYPVVYYIKF